MTGSESTSDTFKVTEHSQGFTTAERERKGDGENFKVQKLFADVQIRYKSP